MTSGQVGDVTPSRFDCPDVTTDAAPRHRDDVTDTQEKSKSLPPTLTKRDKRKETRPLSQPIVLLQHCDVTLQVWRESRERRETDVRFAEGRSRRPISIAAVVASQSRHDIAAAQSRDRRERK